MNTSTTETRHCDSFTAIDPQDPDEMRQFDSCVDFEDAGGDLQKLRDEAGAAGDRDLVDRIDRYLADDTDSYEDAMRDGRADETELQHHHNHHAPAGHPDTCAFCEADRYRAAVSPDGYHYHHNGRLAVIKRHPAGTGWAVDPLAGIDYDSRLTTTIYDSINAAVDAIHQASTV